MKSKSKALLIIDDAKLRRQSALAAQRLARRFDRLAEAAEGYREKDERLFYDWLALTFRDLVSRRDALTQERDALKRLAAEALAYAQYSGYALDRARAFIQAERARYAIGTPEEKAAIGADRRFRDRCSPEGKKRARAEAKKLKIKQREEARAAAEEAGWQRLASLDPTKAQSDPSGGQPLEEILIDALFFARSPERTAIALRLWELSPPELKAGAERIFARLHGVELTAFVRALRGEPDPEGEENFWNEANFAVPPSPAPAKAPESLKLLYLKFVRYLHPDARGAGAHFECWQRRLWHAGQEAYQAGDESGLLNLYWEVLLRLGKLRELSIGEMKNLGVVLEFELHSLQRSTRRMWASPFWKFSQRKEYSSLEDKYRPSFHFQIVRLEREIASLRARLF